MLGPSPSCDTICSDLTYPHAELIHVVRFFHGTISKAKTFEDLQSTTLKAICLAVEDLGAAFVDDPGIDPAMGHPGCAHEAMGGHCQRGGVGMIVGREGGARGMVLLLGKNQMEVVCPWSDTDEIFMMGCGR